MRSNAKTALPELKQTRNKGKCLTARLGKENMLKKRNSHRHLTGEKE